MTNLPDHRESRIPYDCQGGIEIFGRGPQDRNNTPKRLRLRVASQEGRPSLVSEDVGYGKSSNIGLDPHPYETLFGVLVHECPFRARASDLDGGLEGEPEDSEMADPTQVPAVAPRSRGQVLLATITEYPIPHGNIRLQHDQSGGYHGRAGR